MLRDPVHLFRRAPQRRLQTIQRETTFDQHRADIHADDKCFYICENSHFRGTPDPLSRHGSVSRHKNAEWWIILWWLLKDWNTTTTEMRCWLDAVTMTTKTWAHRKQKNSSINSSLIVLVKNRDLYFCGEKKNCVPAGESSAENLLCFLWKLLVRFSGLNWMKLKRARKHLSRFFPPCTTSAMVPSLASFNETLRRLVKNPFSDYFKHIILKRWALVLANTGLTGRWMIRFPASELERCRLFSILHRWPLTIRWWWRRQLFIVRLTIYYKPNEPKEHKVTSAPTQTQYGGVWPSSWCVMVG